MTGREPAEAGVAHARRTPSGAGWAHAVSRRVVPVVWSTRVLDARNVPPGGPVLLAANHLALLDGPLVQSASPRPVHFLVKREAFVGPLGTLLRAAGQVPVDRAGDRSALLAAVDVLRGGGVVGVFPEGTRGTGRLTSLHAGVSWLALQTGAAVVPVAVLGTRRPGERSAGLPPPRRRTHVVFGAPVELAAAPGVPRRTALRQAHAALHAAMQDHVRTAVRRTGQQLPEDSGGHPNRSARGAHQ
ncbi:lysophospholipid acyltransferase family protein [Thalassiella azotivora]